MSSQVHLQTVLLTDSHCLQTVSNLSCHRDGTSTRPSEQAITQCLQDPALYEKLEEPTDDENDMLDLAYGLTET